MDETDPGITIVVAGHGGHPPHLTIFFRKPPHQNRCPPMGHPLHLKIKSPPPSEKQPPPLKRQVPFHEVIPRKSTINDNLKSS